MPPSPSDLDWLQIRRYCLREARRHVASSADAEDVAQNATLRAWCASHSLRDQRSLWPWLARITRNEAMRLYEKTWPECRAELPESHDDGTLADCIALKLDVERAVGQLAPIDQQLVALHYGRDFTCAFAAAQLKLSLPTAKVRLHRVRRRLAQSLSTSSA